ncbi:hypothetical protein ACTPOK_29980 [Streptomyces inhibens]|uniref:hypothetical protein n=1 Tax=Streptomyces inhibens TaxID=2293571 RepID=UPI00402A8CB7
MTTRVAPHTPSPSPSPVLLGDAEVRERLDTATAVPDRDVVIVAINSPTPVVEADCIAPGTHLSALGPKSTTHYEIPPEPATRAAVPRHRLPRPGGQLDLSPQPCSGASASSSARVG